MTEQEFWNLCKELNPGDPCPYCNGDLVDYCNADEPWNDEYLACPKCDSTYFYYKERCNVIDYNAT